MCFSRLHTTKADMPLPASFSYQSNPIMRTAHSVSWAWMLLHKYVQLSPSIKYLKLAWLHVGGNKWFRSAVAWTTEKICVFPLCEQPDDSCSISHSRGWRLNVSSCHGSRPRLTLRGLLLMKLWEQTGVALCCQLGLSVCRIASSSFNGKQGKFCDSGFHFVARAPSDSSCGVRRGGRICCNNWWGSTGNALQEVNRFSWGKRFVEARCCFLRCQTVSLYARVCVNTPSSFLSRCKKWLLHPPPSPPPPPPRLSLLWRDVEMHPPPTLDLAGNSLGWSREERSVYSRTHSERHTYTLIWREFGNMAANAGLPLHRPAVHSHSSQLQYINSSVYGFC